MYLRVARFAADIRTRLDRNERLLGRSLKQRCRSPISPTKYSLTNGAPRASTASAHHSRSDRLISHRSDGLKRDQDSRTQIPWGVIEAGILTGASVRLGRPVRPFLGLPAGALSSRALSKVAPGE